MKLKYTRKDLIEICEQAIVPLKKWDDRDTPGAMESVGKIWVMLKAGAKFEIRKEGDLSTNDNTIWLDIMYPEFMQIENFDEDEEGYYKKHTHCLPTLKRLKKANGKD